MYMMKNVYTYILSILVATFATGCHTVEEWDNNAQGNFDALWTVVDQHYCFFKEKGVDWDAMHELYGKRIYNGMTSQMLFEVCSDMLAELRDGHVNLSARFATSYYTAWWSDYPQNYDERLVEQYYLGFDCRHLGVVQYALLEDNIGFISYPSFATGLGDSNLDAILSYFSLCKGIIIDVRNNGGGALTNAEDLACRFTDDRFLAGYMINKTGPGHDELSEPFEYYYTPAAEPHLLWTKPVVVLTNRSTFSAANNFVSLVKYFPNVKICGARTGGGSGMPLTMELPCGWSIRMSSVSVLDAQKQTTEFGIDPTPGCEVDLDPVMALQGVDTMIEKAISLLNENCE